MYNLKALSLKESTQVSISGFTVTLSPSLILQVHVWDILGAAA